MFTVKHKSDGIMEWYKTRLTANRYTQTYGLDYHNTFTPIIKMNFVKVLVSLVANQGWPLLQFDVTNAFLYGYLEEMYMQPLPAHGFVNLVAKRSVQAKEGLVWP